MSTELSIAFTYPYGNGFDPAWVESVAHLLLHEASKSPEDRLLGSYLKAGSCYVGDNRERIAIDFNNQTQDDWFLMIDPDIAFAHTILEDFAKIIKDYPDAGIIAGRVNLLNGLPVFYYVDTENNANVHWSYPFKGLKEFDLVGTGIMFIKRDALVAMFKAYGPHLFTKVILQSGLGLGDDFSFCVRAQQAGYKVYGAWDIYGQHYKGGVPVPQRYLEYKDLCIFGPK